MARINMERRSQWLPIEPGKYPRLDDSAQLLVGQAAEERGVLIGRWYYYLYSNGESIDLRRTEEKPGQPTLTEVMDPGHLAISDDDLECAVQYESCGIFEPGLYRVSPLIERKLRILFE